MVEQVPEKEGVLILVGPGNQSKRVFTVLFPSSISPIVPLYDERASQAEEFADKTLHLVIAWLGFSVKEPLTYFTALEREGPEIFKRATY